MLPFGRMHTIFYSTLIERVSLSCTMFEDTANYFILAILTHPTCCLQPRLV